MSLVRELGRGLLQLLYPNVCQACDRGLPEEQTRFCAACRDALTRNLLPNCPRCAQSIGPYALLDGGCSACRDLRYHFDAVFRMGPYEEPLRGLILRAKHARGEGTADALGALWAEHCFPVLAGLNARTVVPIPLHWWRRLQRGFNQSEAFARRLADRLNVPCRSRWLRRTRYTLPQTQQTPSGRVANVRGAFRATGFAHGKVSGTVILVDDVLTTGSTCSEASRALKEAGAERVYVAVLARSVKP
jgi:ComF family protein